MRPRWIVRWGRLGARPRPRRQLRVVMGRWKARPPCRAAAARSAAARTHCARCGERPGPERRRCPGHRSLPRAGTGRPCPYASEQVFGQRAEGVLRFPEAVAIGPQGDVYVADQLSYVVQRVQPGRRLRDRVGLLRRRPRPVRADRRPRDGRRRRRLRRRLEPRPDREVRPDGRIHRTLGPPRRRSRASSASAPRRTSPSRPAAASRSPASYVYVADSGNNRIERFNLQGGEAMAWGTKGSGPGQFSYPRGVAANAGEVLVADDDNHRIEQFTPEGAFVAAAARNGTGAGQFGFPYGVALDAAGNVYVADDINHRVVKLTPQLAFAGAWGGFGTKPGQLAFPRALASDPAGDTYVADTANDRIEVFDPEGQLPAHDRHLRPRPGAADRPARAGRRPHGPAARLRHRRQSRRAVRPAQRRLRRPVDARRRRAAASTRPTGIAVDPAGSVYVADTAATPRLTALGRRHLLWQKSAVRPTLGGAQLSGAAGVAVSAATGPDLRRRHAATTACSSTAPKRIAAGASGARAKATAASGSGAAPSTTRDGVAVDGARRRLRRRHRQRPHREALPGGTRARRMGHARDRRRALPRPDRRRRRRRRATSTSSTAKTTASQMFDGNGHFLRQVGQPRHRAAGQLSQPSALAVGCEGASMWPTRTTTAIERFDPARPGRRGGCLAAGQPGRRRSTSRRC